MLASSSEGSRLPYQGFPLGKIPEYPFRRVRCREIMDEPNLDPGLRAEAMAGIERISSWWGQREPLLRALKEKLAQERPRPFRLLELGAGNGQMGRWLGLQLRSSGFEVSVESTDLYEAPGVRSLDCCSEALPEADLYFSSLLLHHLGDWELCQTLRLQATRAKIGFVHFDLQRHFLHYLLARMRLGIAGLGPVNQSDALLSIIQGYSRAELEGLARAAGLPCELQWSFPFRWLLSWKR